MNYFNSSSKFIPTPKSTYYVPSTLYNGYVSVVILALSRFQRFNFLFRWESSSYTLTTISTTVLKFILLLMSQNLSTCCGVWSAFMAFRKRLPSLTQVPWYMWGWTTWNRQPLACALSGHGIALPPQYTSSPVCANLFRGSRYVTTILRTYVRQKNWSVVQIYVHMYICCGEKNSYAFIY